MYRPRKKYRKRKSISIKHYLLGAGGVIVIAAAVLLFTLSPATAVQEEMEMPFTAGTPFEVNSAGIAYISGENYHLMDFDTKPLWENTLYSSDMKLAVSDKLFCAYNQDILHAVDVTGKLLYSKRETGAILSARAGLTRVAYFSEERGNNDDGTKGDIISANLYVLDQEGNVLSEQSFLNQNVVDYGFYGKNEMLWVLALDVSGAIPVSRITTYNPGKYITGTIDVTEQIIEKVIVDNEYIYACGTTHIFIYTLFGDKKDSILIYGWKYMASRIIDDKMYFAYVPREKGEETFGAVKIIRMDKTPISLNLQDNCQQAVFTDKLLYCISGSNILSYTLDGVFNNVTPMPISYDSVLKTGSDYAYTAKGDGVFQIALR